MTTKIKTTLMTGLFIFGLLTGLQAQDNYDFMMAFLDMTKPVIHIVQNDVPEKVIETGKKNTGLEQNERLLSTISRLTSEGWEVISVSGLTFYLRKKKQ